MSASTEKYSMIMSFIIDNYRCQEKYTKQSHKSLRGESFLCHLFSVKSVQNLRKFWRTTQNSGQKDSKEPEVTEGARHHVEQEKWDRVNISI